jgi:citrate synthase
MGYDPAFMNTASCRSRVTFIDGDKGILRYRGYDIADLATKSTHLEVAYLLLNGELPDQKQLDEWTYEISMHTMVHENVKKFMDGFRHDAHPMGMLVSTVAALSTFYPGVEAGAGPGRPPRADRPPHRQDADAGGLRVPPLHGAAVHGPGQRAQLRRQLPQHDVPHDGASLRGEPGAGARAERAVHPARRPRAELQHQRDAQRGQRAGGPVRVGGRRRAALYGPLHGGANEQVLRMLQKIGSKENIPGYIEQVKKGEFRLMGFGHRVYKNYDPRAKILRDMAKQVFDVTGSNPLLDIAVELERISLEDDYFVSRKLYPNVDFYSGIIYQAMGFPVDMFPVLFAIPRTVGWLAQWEEMLRTASRRSPGPGRSTRAPTSGSHGAAVNRPV